MAAVDRNSGAVSDVRVIAGGSVRAIVQQLRRHAGSDRMTVITRPATDGTDAIRVQIIDSPPRKRIRQ